MVWILDCSFAAALFLPDEKSDKTSSFFNGLSEEDQVIVPLLWWYEISNVLLLSVKRKRLTHKDATNILELVKDIGIATDTAHGHDYSRELFEHSHMYRLSAYDAAYLELALRKKGSLATLDAELAKAAGKAGITIYKII